MSHSDISRDGFTLVVNEEQSYFRLKERIREKNIQLGGIGQSVIIEHGKRIGQNQRRSITSTEIITRSYHTA